VQRNTRYEVLQRFGSDPTADPRLPVDDIKDPEAVFGSYAELTRRAREDKRLVLLDARR
jgi:hypothetical protein